MFESQVRLRSCGSALDLEPVAFRGYLQNHVVYCFCETILCLLELLICFYLILIQF